METSVSPENIHDRAEVLTSTAEKEAADAKAKADADAAKAAADKAAADAAAQPAADAAAKATADKAAADAATTPEKKIPNDPAEMRKWATKASQESAALRDEVKALKAAIEKMTKKPIDYKELAKNPDSIKAQIEAERAEAVAEMEDRLEEATTRAVANETRVERLKREQDKANYPRWEKLFPLIQNLAQNADGRINFTKAPGDILDDLYALAGQLSPEDKPVASATKTVEQIATEAAAAAAKPKTYTEAELEAAKKEAFDKAQKALRDEQNGAGIAGAGKGGRRDGSVSKKALMEMPLKDLKSLISKE